jgi:hypothetical protein
VHALQEEAPRHRRAARPQLAQTNELVDDKLDYPRIGSPTLAHTHILKLHNMGQAGQAGGGGPAGLRQVNRETAARGGESNGSLGRAGAHRARRLQNCATKEVVCFRFLS